MDNPLNKLYNCMKTERGCSSFSKDVPNYVYCKLFPRRMTLIFRWCSLWSREHQILYANHHIIGIIEQININSCYNPQVPHEWIFYSLCNFSVHILSILSICDKLEIAFYSWSHLRRCKLISANTSFFKSKIFYFFIFF